MKVVDFVWPAGPLKSSEKAPKKAVELSLAPTILVLLLTVETVDLETVIPIVAVAPFSAVMVTV